MKPIHPAWLGLACLLAPAFSLPAANADMFTSATLGQTATGEPLHVYTLKNKHGCEAKITDYGGTLMSLTMPDKAGKLGDIVLGFDSPEGYFSAEFLKANPFFGALIGRYGNRIAKGQFTLDGKSYQLAINNSPNNLHGGTKGFDKVVWQAKEGKNPAGPSLELTYLSKDGDENFPGNLAVSASYTLTDKNELIVRFHATTDQDTVVNLTHHSYFNLAGAGSGDILDELLTIHADAYLPIDADSIPLGKPAAVRGTPFDFTQPQKIGARIGDDDVQLKNAKGYDHTFVLNGYKPGGALHVAARVEDPTSGRVLTLETDQPGVQFYSGNFLDGTLTGKGGHVYQKHAGLCLEPQHYPDSPNHPDYPSTVLKAGQTYETEMVFKFTVAK